MIFPMMIGEKIRRLRLARGLTQETLARRARIGRVALVNIELGKKEPKLRTLDRVARALRVAARDLLGPIRMLDGELRRPWRRGSR